MIAQKPVVAITMGDPAGVGPEVAVAAALDAAVQDACIPVIYGIPAVVDKALSLVAPNASSMVILRAPQPPQAGTIQVRPTQTEAQPFSPGLVSAAAGQAAALAVHAATHDALNGKVAAVATAPLHKEALHAAGYPFPGHTEMVSTWCGASDVGMLLCGDRLRVIHVTTHEALGSALKRLTIEKVHYSITLISRFLHAIGLEKAPIAVAGLNPHAGEGGLFGDAEVTMIKPAIALAKQQGLPVYGPFAPDTVFRRAYLGEFGGVVAMYHDQGHIAIKMVEFATAVNVTLGLPIIRTSADHGTAFDIAWRGLADPTSMQRAVLLAARLARQ